MNDTPKQLSLHTLSIWRAPFRYDPEGAIIFDARGERILDVRGWGYLTGRGAGALGMSDDKANEVRDQVGENVAAMLTEIWQAR